MISSTIITALATPPGTSGIAVIRCSGANCIKNVTSIFKGPNLDKVPANTIHFGKILDITGRVIDEVLVSVFRAPKSYTGEDSVEISCHGGIVVIQQILECLYAVGCQPAQPGEFTKRAFLNGKIELSQAEAVADVIHAKSKRALALAERQLEGKLGQHIQHFRQQIIDLTALVELELDFIEEDVEFASRDRLISLIDELRLEIQALLRTYESGKIVRDGVRTAIVGKPNVGKSTLLNTLLGQERAIVSEIAGTTRDVIDVEWSIDGLLYRLIDTAGLRVTQDIIEAEGVKRSIIEMDKADMILFLIDSTDPDFESEWKKAEDLRKEKIHVKLLICATKSDQKHIHKENVLPISAKTGDGINSLRTAMRDAVTLSGVGEESSLMVTSARHYQALEKADGFLESAKKAVQSNISGEFLSSDLRSALYQLGTITGVITNEDVLDSVFSRFCIGK